MTNADHYTECDNKQIDSQDEFPGGFPNKRGLDSSRRFCCLSGAFFGFLNRGSAAQPQYIRKTVKAEWELKRFNALLTFSSFLFWNSSFSICFSPQPTAARNSRTPRKLRIYSPHFRVYQVINWKFQFFWSLTLFRLHFDKWAHAWRGLITNFRQGEAHK